MHKRFYDYASKIDSLITGCSEAVLAEAESYFQQEGIFVYFIQKISKSLNVDWLPLLRDKGYFDPSKNPQPVTLPDSKGFTVPYWNVLSYLEIAAKENGKFPRQDISRTLLGIVNGIIEYRDPTNERIDNYITDWIVVTVLSNLPTELLTGNHIEFIRAALNSKWDSSLLAADLGKDLYPKL